MGLAGFNRNRRREEVERGAADKPASESMRETLERVNVGDIQSYDELREEHQRLFEEETPEALRAQPDPEAAGTQTEPDETPAGGVPNEEPVQTQPVEQAKTTKPTKKG